MLPYLVSEVAKPGRVFNIDMTSVPLASDVRFFSVQNIHAYFI